MARHAPLLLLLALLAVGSSSGTAARTDASQLRLATGGLAALPQAAGARTAWCGDGESAVDRKPDVEASSEREVHVIYAIPADGADRFGELAPAIATDVGAIDSWWQAQDPARAPRWDRFAFPGCATRAGTLDIRSVRLPRGAAAYLDSESIDPLIDDLLPIVGPVEKALVYYDGPRSEPRICGTSTMAALYAGKFAFSFIWIGASCNGDFGAGGSAAATAAHELLHDLGAVPLVGPPHTCAAMGVSGHVCDDTSDIMFPYSSGFALGAMKLDVGHDDYYAHSGSWWDVQDSAWLSHLPEHRLQVVVQGAGRVVTEPVGIDCGTSCDALWDDGLTVHLVAKPDADSRLRGWSGACSGWGACVATMASDEAVTATFGPQAYHVSVGVTGRGRVVSTPAGIACGRSCGGWFAPGASVVLRAQPARSWRLARWTGACRGRGACTLRAVRDATVGAVFTRS